MKTTAVQLGRYAPPHGGHERTIRKMLDRHGNNGSLVMIGSSTNFDRRTPFTFEQRRGLIQRIFPDIQIVGLPDIERTGLYHLESTVPLWLAQLKTVERQMNTKFRFYGGSQADMQFFDGVFDYEVIVDRQGEGEGITATDVRALLQDGNREALQAVMNELIIDETIALFRQNMQKLGLL